jgi:hypothetical protein
LSHSRASDAEADQSAGELRGGATGAAPRRVAAAVLAVALACGVLAGCGGGSGGSGLQYTVRSVKAGFVRKADLGGNGILAIQDTEHSNHIIYTPTDSVPTCPYSQRADDLTHHVEAALELNGGNSTGRFILGPQDPRRRQVPVVTQGAVVFKSTALAADGMKKVTAEAAKCPSAFTILGGPPEIVGHYTVNSRPVSLEGWTGFSQQLAHTPPREVDPDYYDDLDTVVVRKGNAIVYAGFAQVKRVGQRADSAAKAQQTMQRTLGRLG